MEIKREIKISRYGDKRRQKYDMPKYMGYSKSSSEREVHSNTGLPQETKISNNLTVHLKELEEQMKPKVSRRKDQSGNKNQSRNK